MVMVTDLHVSKMELRSSNTLGLGILAILRVSMPRVVKTLTKVSYQQADFYTSSCPALMLLQPFH